MIQYMPYGGFKWVEPTLNELNDMTDTSPIGRIYEVDLSYPQEFHNKYNDLPFLPQNSIPPGSKIKKLLATLEPKKNYIVHCRNFQQAIKNGLKVHRVLQFNKSPGLVDYISLNTKMRKKATNDFEKDFFKLMNNALFVNAIAYGLSEWWNRDHVFISSSILRTTLMKNNNFGIDDLG
ncbi:uncharacterized protein LOC113559737 [Rhopalosiphum maidis]|uniref:uncharacterized protein LOC113559737 n=1 Tax=Rhopalosiphum maidis TaxID=43146 RepID=UPI000EFDB9D8|nr:uncharacterized protein LOC113559737 [Rhopalosiphum maidis]